MTSQLYGEGVNILVRTINKFIVLKSVRTAISGKGKNSNFRVFSMFLCYSEYKVLLF